MDKLHCPECGVHIDEHLAGRCLDAWIGGSIMNLDRVIIDDEDGEAIYKRYPSAIAWGFVPSYSTDIAATWEVVEKITEPPKDIETSRRMSNTIFSRWFDTANLWACSASEASLEICRAVIKAVLR